MFLGPLKARSSQKANRSDIIKGLKESKSVNKTRISENKASPNKNKSILRRSKRYQRASSKIFIKQIKYNF